MAIESSKSISRQSEAEKTGKARRPTCAGRHSPTDSEETGASQALSPAERKILLAFREYLMTPGEMLCFGLQDLNAVGAPLDTLTDRGLLVAERFRGGYSLTETGFAAMQAVA